MEQNVSIREQIRTKELKNGAICGNKENVIKWEKLIWSIYFGDSG